MDTTRRTFVGMTAIIVAGPSIAAGRLLSPTPAEITGPFYPIVKPRERDADLTRISGKTGRATGQIIELTGQLFNRQARPIAGAQIELWQANAAGRYRHPSDDNAAALDPSFDGYARLATDANGEFRFLTVKPGGYDGGRRGYRTPHLHFDVSARINRMVTQMYFPDELHTNAADQLLSACIDPPALVARPMPAREDGITRYTWTFVLRDG